MNIIAVTARLPETFPIQKKMNADGSNPVNLSKTPKATEAGRPPSWSPDDQWILFNSDSDGDNEVYRIHPDGTGLQKITDNDLNDFNPSFSPDGKFIAFISNRKGTKSERDNRIYIMSADGSNQHQIGDISPIHGSLSWSPKCDQLVFNSYDSKSYSIEIFSIGIDGTNLCQLTSSPSQPLLDVLRNKSISEAQKMFAEGKKKGSMNNLFAYYSMKRLGIEYLAIREYDRAIAAITFLTEAYPEEADSWSSLGEVYKESGDKKNAIRCLEKSLTLDSPPYLRDRSVKMLGELGAKN